MAFSFLFIDTLKITKQHYGQPLLFVDDNGLAAYGYVTKAKGPMVTLKPSEKSNVTLTKNRKFLCLVEPAGNLTVDDHVLVCLADGEYYGDSESNLSYCLADRFQNLTVLKLTQIYDDFVYGDSGNGIEIKIPSSHVFKLPDGWTFKSTTNNDSEPGPSSKDDSTNEFRKSHADDSFLSALLTRIMEEYHILHKLYSAESESNIDNCINYRNALETIKELQDQILSLIKEKESFTKVTYEKIVIIEKTYQRRIESLETEISSLKARLAEKTAENEALKERCRNQSVQNEELEAKIAKLDDKVKHQEHEKRKKNFVKVPLPTMSSSQVSTRTLNERIKSLHKLLKLLSTRGDSNETDEISITLGHYLKKHPEITLKALDIAGISVNTKLNPGQSLDLKLLLKLPMYRLRDLRSYLSSLGINILASEKTIRAEMDKRNEGKDVTVCVMDLKCKTNDTETSKVAVITVDDPEAHLRSTINSSLSKNQLRVIHDNDHREIWCKLGKSILCCLRSEPLSLPVLESPGLHVTGSPSILKGYPHSSILVSPCYVVNENTRKID